MAKYKKGNLKKRRRMTQEEINEFLLFHTDLFLKNIVAKRINEIQLEMLEEFKPYLKLLERMTIEQALEVVGDKRNEQFRKALKRSQKLLLSYLNEELSQNVTDFYTDIYQLTLDLAQEQVKKDKLILTDKISFNKPDMSYIDAIVTSMNTYFIRASEGIEKNIKKVINDKINRTLIRQNLSSGTLKQSIEELTQELQKNGIVSVKTKHKYYGLRTYTEMVIRTESNTMLNEAMVRTANNIGYLYVRASKHAGASDRCKPYEGQIYFIGKDESLNFLKKRHLKEVTGPNKLLGINCRHRVTPYYVQIPKEIKLILEKVK